VTLAVEVLPATLANKTAISRLLELYQYDFAEFTGDDVDEQGSYGYRYLDQYWTDADRHAFLFRCEENIAGFAFVLSGSPHDMVQFFVMRKYRGTGLAVAAARSVFARFPGEWQVREVAANKRAIAFWRNAIPVPFTEGTNDKGPVQHFHIAEQGEPRG
jgi:predicted acetyltransferase